MCNRRHTASLRMESSNSNIIYYSYRLHLRIGECPSNSPFLKDNGAEAHCF
jgi:hypothetical protein